MAECGIEMRAVRGDLRRQRTRVTSEAASLELKRKRIMQCPIPRRVRSATERPFRWIVVVLMLAALVHQTVVAPVSADDASWLSGARLPAPVMEMRERILGAVATGRIEDLREPLEWNELPFMYRDGDDGGDPIAYWRGLSADGEGREVLGDIGRLLALAPARLALGRDVENSAVYVWPYLAERPLDRLTPEEQKDLLGLMPDGAATAMRTAGRWTWWRLVIGADGTWHALKKTP